MAANLRSYSIITAAYWVFTLTDGALRMLVLLHLHDQGYSPWQVASLFLLYEFFGVVTNLVGGWLGARSGLKLTLLLGLSLQIAACGLLTLPLTLLLVLAAQGLCGIAKDLTKMSAKSYIKFVVPEGHSQGLMRWVALLTGSKNTLKGVGFFLGGFLLNVLGFPRACLAMICGLALALLASTLLLPNEKPTGAKPKFKHLFSHTAAINWLAGARFFLFGSRDAWFVIGLPLFLSMSLEWSHTQVGSFLAAWVIGYGIVQALAPRILPTTGDGAGHGAVSGLQLGGWSLSLLLPLAALPPLLQTNLPPGTVLTSCLGIYGILFAINSAVHSYLIVEYADGDKIAMKVGFYYMANAAGRLFGTVLSGALFQLAGQGVSGLSACIYGSIVLVGCSAFLCLPLHRSHRAAISE